MAFWRGAAVLLTVDGDKLPTEFRLFKAGLNRTRNGDFVFDDEAAASVMAAYSEHGVDVMIDLEHLAVAAEDVTGDARNFDPDARGWCKIAVRSGELWAVQVTWTPEGADRLRSKKQRYVSPAFNVDAEGRVTDLFNIALTAVPATDSTPALVAASRARGRQMDPKTLAKFVTLLRAGKSHSDAMALLSIDLKTLQSMGKLLGVESGADLGALIAAVLSFADELSNPQQDAPPEPEPAALAEGDKDDEPATLAENKKDDEPVAARANTGELELLRADAKKQAAELTVLRKEREERESVERRGLVAALVKLGRETPATAWADDDGTKPRGSLGTMLLSELRDRVKAFGGVPMLGTAPQQPTGGGGGATQSNLIEMSEYEQNRVRAKAKLLGGDAEAAVKRYAEVREQQVRGAEQTTPTMCRMLSRPLTQACVLADVEGRFGPAELVLLTNPVKPIEEFGVSSQRALEEFRLEHNATLVSLPEAWSEKIGDLLPGGSLQDTYPIAFEGVKYRERLAQNAAATTPIAVDIAVKKREFSAAKQAQLRRITHGDFAYVKTWQNSAATMARARINMRNHLVTALLEAGTSGYWGQSAELATGIDGQPFFSASHKVNPFDTKMKFHGSATWSNYQASAKPLGGTSGADNLTGEKASMIYIPGPDGEELNSRATGMLIPTTLEEVARLLLTVQDVIIDSGLKGAGIRNEHYQSGFERTWAPQLAGTGVTANYYLYSLEAISRGIPPWVLAEDAAEELRTWDESSDFYKDSGMIKIESIVFANAALLYPHGIRLVKGT